MQCAARHDFRYGDQLAGSSLKPRALPPLMSMGRAWGAGIAAWHASVPTQIPLVLPDGPTPEMIAESVLIDALARDAAENGTFDLERWEMARDTLLVLLEHYRATVDPMPIESLEQEFDVPLRARSGQRASTRYRLTAFVDALDRSRGRKPWIVEFKLRTRLQPVWLVTMSRQVRFYAWAFREHTGEEPAGVIVDERLNQAPVPAKLVRARRKGEGVDGLVPSHTASQLTTPELYLDACRRFDVAPDPETVGGLRQRVWHQRVPIQLRSSEIDETGRELTSAAKLIGLFDRHELFPMRNATQANCSWCDFRDVCASPDSALVDAMFDRTVPKRDRDKGEQQ